MTMRARYLLRLSITAAFLVALVLIVDVPATLNRLVAMDLRWIAVAVACFSAVTVLMAWRWQITAGQLGTSFRLGWAVREYYLSQLVNLYLPGGVLGDAGRVLRTPKGDGGLARAAHAVLIERLAGQVGLLLVALCGVIIALVPGGMVWPEWLINGLIWAACVIGVCGVLLVAILKRAEPFRLFFQSVRTAFLARNVIFWQLLLSLGAALLMTAAFAACAYTTGTRLPLEAVLMLAPLILTAMMIPVSVGGWGLREGAAAALFPIVGASASAGVAAASAYGIALMIACLPGLLMIRLRGKSDQTKPPGGR